VNLASASSTVSAITPVAPCRSKTSAWISFRRASLSVGSPAHMCSTDCDAGGLSNPPRLWARG